MEALSIIFELTVLFGVGVWFGALAKPPLARVRSRSVEEARHRNAQESWF